MFLWKMPLEFWWRLLWIHTLLGKYGHFKKTNSSIHKYRYLFILFLSPLTFTNGL
jgi:hypothetical protein